MPQISGNSHGAHNKTRHTLDIEFNFNRFLFFVIQLLIWPVWPSGVFAFQGRRF
jgi:hypothetical protein